MNKLPKFIIKQISEEDKINTYMKRLSRKKAQKSLNISKKWTKRNQENAKTKLNNNKNPRKIEMFNERE